MLELLNQHVLVSNLTLNIEEKLNTN